MHSARAVPLVLLVALSPGAGSALAESLGSVLDLSGYVRADYGSGDRYRDARNGEGFEVSQISVELTAQPRNIVAFVRLAATNVLAERAEESEVFVSDAFVTWKGFAGDGSELLVGLQPILFGLRAAGFPGDRSLHPGLEFGGAGGFAVARQAGPAIVYRYAPGDTFSFSAGAFDTSSSAAQYRDETGPGEIDGSSLTKNYFVDLRWDAIDGRGLYCFLGWEKRYVGEEVDASRPVFAAGAGWGTSRFDIALQRIDLARELVATRHDETYTVAELTVHLGRRTDLYLDWARGQESARRTQRLGLVHRLNRALDLQLEYADDDLGNHDLDLDRVAETSVDSIDGRLTFTF